MRKQKFVRHARRRSRSHERLTLALSAELDPAEAGRVHAELDGLAVMLRDLWDRPPRDQLVGCAAAMAERFVACGDHSLDDVLLHRVLARRVGHPLLLGIIAADVGRRAGLPLGLVGEGDVQHLAHVVLPEPIVADPRAGFALVDLCGREAEMRWPDPQEVAAIVLTLISATAHRTGEVEWANRADDFRQALVGPSLQQRDGDL